MEKYVLKAQNITKVFPGTVALDDVSVSFESGCVHAVIGKNGSGKSTLMKIISGVHKQTKGELFLNEEKLVNDSPIDSMKSGIMVVYQELSLVKDLSVGENIFMGRLPMKDKLRVDWKKVHSESEKILKHLGVSIPTKTLVKDLFVGQQQIVEIAKAMSFGPKVLILDEPTSALSSSECENLFKVIRELRSKGIIILYITHRLQELAGVTDTITVLRDGKFVGTVITKETETPQIIQMMFGDTKRNEKPRNDSITGEIVLEVNNLTGSKFTDVSFKLKKGEILGVAGMMGSGRTELLRALFGADKYTSGEIIVNGKKQERINPITMKECGIGYAPENRKEEGMCLNLSIANNLCMASIYDITDRLKINRKRESEYVDRQVENLSIKTPDTKAEATSLSGGNQQKVVLGNWLNTDPMIIFLDEPTRGIDVEAKQQIFNIIWDTVKKGVSFLFVSSELEEILEVCDRTLIMRHGVLVSEIGTDELNVEKIYSECMKGEN